MYYLALDQGGSSSRALVINRQGKTIAQAQIEVETQYKNGHVEQCPDEVISSLIHCIKNCLLQLSLSEKKQLVAASLVTQRASFIAIDTNTMQPLTNIISWQDCRSAKVLTELNLDENRVTNLTGLQCSTHYGASKMLWLLRYNLPVKTAFTDNRLVFLPVASYLAATLTKSRNFLVDPVNASRTLLFSITPAARSIQEKLSWDKSLLTAFFQKNNTQISCEHLPQICHNDNDFGNISCQDKKLPLKYLSGDQSAALFSHGMPSTESLYINIGTGAFVSQVLENDLIPIEDIIAKGLLKSVVHSGNKSLGDLANADDKGMLFALEATVNGASSAIKQMKQSLNVLPEALNITQLQQSDIPIFINGVGGLAAPHWRSDIQSKFYEVIDHSPEQKMVAVIESIAFMLCDIYQAISLLQVEQNHNFIKQALAPINTLIVTGGLSNLTPLIQMLSDLTGKKVIKPEHVEASVLGSAWWLAGQPKQWLTENNCNLFAPKENRSLAIRYARWKTQLQKVLDAENRAKS